MIKPGSGVKHLRKQVNWTDQVWEIYERTTGKPRPALFQQQRDEEISKLSLNSPK